MFPGFKDIGSGPLNHKNAPFETFTYLSLRELIWTARFVGFKLLDISPQPLQTTRTEVKNPSTHDE